MERASKQQQMANTEVIRRVPYGQHKWQMLNAALCRKSIFVNILSSM
jgi:hypothetical protein